MSFPKVYILSAGLRMSRCVGFVLLLSLLLPAIAARAQHNSGANTAASQREKMQAIPRQLWPPHPEAKMEQRYFDIDAKRSIGIGPDEVMQRAREFIRTDSTYYVGWMLEGQYKYDHAADLLGYKNAAVPLEKALRLLEHDYAKALATRTDSILVFYPIRIIQVDYTMIAYYLIQCYSNTDQPDKAFALLRHALKWKMQASYYLDIYNYMAWTVHRNRFYTSEKYPFLKNSIDENERLANRYLDTAIRWINYNRRINDKLAPFFPFMKDNDEREMVGVYHYKCILYSYAFNIDSAEHYFGLMRDANRLPHNNYANFKSVCGEFRKAEGEYKKASEQDDDKRLQEWAYYSTILDIYKGMPRDGAKLAKDMITAAGTTPGYGWYNIARARCMLYDGQTSEAERYADKAADFKELHIGTTLGQSHYDFSIQLLKLIGKEQEWQMDKFEHSNWWYNPKVLLDMSQKLSEKYLQQFLIINQFAQNPERDRVIYKLFSTESTVSWDEIWYLVHDFSTHYFLERFRKEAEQDKRPIIRKYFNLFVAKLNMQQGKYDDAKAQLDKLVNDPTIDGEYEKLFVARLYEAEAECAQHFKNTTAYNDWMYKLCVSYPQLAPFTGMKPNMALHISGDVDKDAADALKGCNINWVTNSSIPSLQAFVIFTRNGAKKDITYYVLDHAGNYVVPKQAFAWQKAEEAGTSLAYRLFNIGTKEPEDPPKKTSK
jgi:hypothetical protein